MEQQKKNINKKKQISTKDLVVNAIKAEPYFKGFRYNRSDSTFYKYTEWGHFGLFVRSRMICPGESEIRIEASVHFRILTDWFSKYSYFRMGDLLTYSTVLQSIIFNTKYGSIFVDNCMFVHRDSEQFASELEELVYKTVVQASELYSKYDNIDTYYEEVAKDEIDRIDELFSNGMRMACHLAAAKIACPEEYGKLKQLYYENWKDKKEKGWESYDIDYYFPDIEEIYAYLDSINLKDQIIKRHSEKNLSDAVFARRTEGGPAKKILS